MGAPPVATAVLIYDAECAMCRASALWLMRLALSGGALEILPCRSEPRRKRFPEISDTACTTAMQLVLPDGREPADAPEQLGHRVGAAQHATVGQDELHRRRARRVGDLREARAPRLGAARQDLERPAGERQAHEPERARPAHRALAVVDQDGRGYGRRPHRLSVR